mgnify:CR=1 FL=1
MRSRPAHLVLPLQRALCVRGTKEELEIIDRTVEACRAGETLLISDTREKEGKLLPPKSGLFVIAAQAGVDVVPVRIRYDTPDGRCGCSAG